MKELNSWPFFFCWFLGRFGLEEKGWGAYRNIEFRDRRWVGRGDTSGVVFRSCINWILTLSYLRAKSCLDRKKWFLKNKREWTYSKERKQNNINIQYTLKTHLAKCKYSTVQYIFSANDESQFFKFYTQKDILSWKMCGKAKQDWINLNHPHGDKGLLDISCQLSDICSVFFSLSDIDSP